MGSVKAKQFLSADVLVLEVDGSEVSSSVANGAGLVGGGKHIATAIKGTAADANLVTITLNEPFGLAPHVLFQSKTLDCECRLEATPGLRSFQVRTLKSTDLTTGVNDADYTIFVFGTREIREGGAY